MPPVPGSLAPKPTISHLDTNATTEDADRFATMFPSPCHGLVGPWLGGHPPHVANEQLGLAVTVFDYLSKTGSQRQSPPKRPQTLLPLHHLAPWHLMGHACHWWQLKEGSCYFRDLPAKPGDLLPPFGPGWRGR